MNHLGTISCDSASTRVSTRSRPGAVPSRIEDSEALLRAPPRPGRKRTYKSDVTHAAQKGTGNYVQWMIDSVKSRLQALVEAFLA